MLRALAITDFLRDARHLGGVGLVGLGVVGALLPLPGGVDALVIILAASHPEMWIYYTLMATIGTVAGGALLYRVGVRGENGALLVRFSERKLSPLRNHFANHGSVTLLMSGIAPPPFPATPIFIIAGAARYPFRKFLLWTTVSRVVRYSVIAIAAAVLGRRALNHITRHTWVGVVVVAALAATVAAYLWWYRRSMS